MKIYENEENIEILCIPVRDNDEPGTPSWLAEFTIIKGNEDNAFSMNIDQERNVGCLLVLKVNAEGGKLPVVQRYITNGNHLEFFWKLFDGM